MNNIQRRIRGGIVLSSLLIIGLAASACEFSFNYAEVVAPLGVVGEVGVRVYKEHKNCTLPSMDDYVFESKNIQILGETAWETIDRNVYEKWFQVSLATLGDGFLKISKDCSKQGYEEAVLPITVQDPTADGVWQMALDGAYPFESPEIAFVSTTRGHAVVTDGILTLGDQSFTLPAAPTDLDGDLGEVRVFYTNDARETLLLIASDDWFVRFDHMLDSDT